ncbi:hypothetical protein CHS0354_008595 [Potamilus streckersoni]|uniref:Phosphatidylinositol-glycan biosynthesis class X protein n=1 Tax=Potamilus streckersoni TaxID=2493646 RepID=A0AAE0SWJ7_9BIVA|nr:hypothetical protein CHS0354_008595 [Potamilus streckersoni]
MFPTGSRISRCMLCVGLTIYSLIAVVVSSNIVATVSRTIDKNGFHRNLRTEISIPRESIHFKPSTGDIACAVLLEETLPSGAFVDPYQLESLRAFGGPDVLCLHDVDTEKPEFLSQPLTIFIFSHLHLHEGHWTSNVTIPIHMRYQRPFQRQDYVTVTFLNPALFLRCPDTADTGEYDNIEIVFACDSMNQAVCTWFRIDYTSTKGNLDVQVPVGRLEHLPFVIGATIIITLLGCIMLIYMVIYHLPSQKKSKDS